MISIDMAIKMGAKKLKDYLVKNGGRFEITVTKANQWLQENVSGLQVKGVVDMGTQEVKIIIESVDETSEK